MGFIKRLGWYLVGLSIGLIFLVFFLKKKTKETGTEFCYMPNCRVLKDIRSKPIHYSELMNEELDSLELAAFLYEGNVDFKLSDTDIEPCKIYIIENEEGQTLKIKNCPEKAIVESVD